MAKYRHTPATRKKEWKNRLLAGVGSGLTMTDAAKAAKIERTYAYRVMREDSEFAEQYRAAMEESADMLEREARRRATEGCERKKFYLGQAIKDPETGAQYVEREYSDTLLIFLLKGRRPEVFGDRMQHTLDVLPAAVKILTPLTRDRIHSPN